MKQGLQNLCFSFTLATSIIRGSIIGAPKEDLDTSSEVKNKVELCMVSEHDIVPLHYEGLV